MPGGGDGCARDARAAAWHSRKSVCDQDTVAQSYRSPQRTEVEEVAHLLLRQREQLDRSLGHLRLDALDVGAEAFRLLLDAAFQQYIE